MHHVVSLLLLLLTLSLNLPSPISAQPPSPHQSEPSANLAIHLLITQRTHLDNLHPLLTTLYHPQNFYLIEITADLYTIRSATIEWIKALAKDKNNLWVRLRNRLVVRDGVSEVLETISAMRFLLDKGLQSGGDRNGSSGGLFDYFVNVGAEEVVVGNGERMRKVLGYVKERVEDGMLIDMGDARRWKSDESLRRVDYLHYDPSIVFADREGEDGLIQTGELHPDRGLRRWTIARGEAEIIVAREFVSEIVGGMLAKRILLMMGESSHAREHYFQTVAFNDERFRAHILLGNLRCTVDAEAGKNVEEMVEGVVEDGCLFVKGADTQSLADFRRSLRAVLEREGEEVARSQFERVRSLVDPLLGS